MGQDLAGPVFFSNFPLESAYVIDNAIEGFSATITTIAGLFTDSVFGPIA